MMKNLGQIELMTKRNRQTGIFMIKKMLAVCCFLLLLFNISFAVEIQWQFRTPFGESDSSPAVGDLDDDGLPDLVLCSTSGRIFALDGNGREKWYFDTGQTISNAPTLTDLHTGHPLVYAITNPGKIFCLDGQTGARIWDFNMPSAVDWGATLIVAADIDMHQGTEIIVADNGGHLICLSNQGAPLWQIMNKSRFNTAPAVADIDLDGKPDILIGTSTAPVVCFSGHGEKKWQLSEGKSCGSSPVICDLNHDRKPEILVGRDESLTLLDNQGVVQWDYQMRKSIHDAIAVGDLDGDGMKEIVAVDLFGQAVCLDYNGKLLWKANVEERVRRSPAIADIDGDFRPEIVIGGYSAALHIFDTEGNLEERITLSRAMNSSPTIVDFRNDHRLAVVTAAETEVTAFSWMTSPPGMKPAILWGEYRVNSARSGSMVGLKESRTPLLSNIDYGGMYVGTNEFRVDISNPERKSLKIEAEIIKNGDKPYNSAFSASDSLIKLSMPYTIVGREAINLTFKITLRMGKSVLDFHEETYYLVPFARDLADLKKWLAKIDEKISALPDPSYVEDHLLIFKNRLNRLEGQTKLTGTLSALERSSLRDAMRDLRNKTRQLLAMTNAAVKAAGVLAVYHTNPWSPFAGRDEIVENRMLEPDLSIEAFSGEKEHAALNLANFSGRPLTVRIEPEPLVCMADSSKQEFRKVLTMHEVLNVPSQSLDLSADALPLLGQARTLIIPPWDVRQLWLDIDASALKSGNWQTVLRFKTLEVESNEVSSLLSVTVWPANLSTPQPLKLCHWGYVYSSILKDQPQAAFLDQVSHGTNVFVATNKYAPVANFDENGDLTGGLDFSEHDPYVRQHAGQGIILFFNYQVSLKGPAERFSGTWIKAYKEWLTSWIAHLKQMGIDYDKYALYPIDEPGLNEGLVDNFIAFSKPVREIDPNVRIYTDPVGRATMNDLKRMAPYVDIWCPNRNGYLLKEGLDKLDFMKSMGKTVWTYECEANAKHQSPLGYYRGQAWLAWHHGLTGIGFWSYCTSRYDPWYVPQGGADYLLIYQGEGVVTSKRWEAIRDGIEDYNLLTQIGEKMDRLKSEKQLSDKINAAEKLFSAEATRIAGFCGIDPDGTIPGVRGLSEVRKVEDARWEKYKEVRRQMAWLLEELARTN